MLVKILTNLDLDDVGSVVSVAVLQVLEYSPDADEDGDADHGKSKGGVLGLSAKDLGDDYAEDGETRNPGPDRDEPKDSGKENSEPNALRKLEQSQVEVHEASRPGFRRKSPGARVASRGSVRWIIQAGIAYGKRGAVRCLDSPS